MCKVGKDIWDYSHMFVLIHPLVFHCLSRYCRQVSLQSPIFDNTPYCFKYTLTINTAWTVPWQITSQSQSEDKDSVYLLKQMNSQYSRGSVCSFIGNFTGSFWHFKGILPRAPMNFWPWFQPCWLSPWNYEIGCYAHASGYQGAC